MALEDVLVSLDMKRYNINIWIKVFLGERFALLSVKIALFYILKNFEVLRCKETTVPIELDPRAALSRSKNGVKLKLRRIII